MKTLTIRALQEIINKTKNQELKLLAQLELAKRLELIINHIRKAL